MVGVFILGDEEESKGDREEQKVNYLKIEKDPLLPVSENRRKSQPLSTPLHEALATKPDVDDINEDLLEQEFEEGFEEF